MVVLLLFNIIQFTLQYSWKTKTSCTPYDGLNADQTDVHLANLLKKLIHQALFCLFKIDQHDSICWLFVEFPNKNLECPDMESWYSPLKYCCIPAQQHFHCPITSNCSRDTFWVWYTVYIEITNNVRIFVRKTYIEPQDFPAETVNFSVNGETERLLFITSVYMPHEVDPRNTYTHFLSLWAFFLSTPSGSIVFKHSLTLSLSVLVPLCISFWWILR